MGKKLLIFRDNILVSDPKDTQITIGHFYSQYILLIRLATILQLILWKTKRYLNHKYV